MFFHGQKRTRDESDDSIMELNGVDLFGWMGISVCESMFEKMFTLVENR